MPTSPALCPNCNTIVQINNAIEANICPCCGAPFVTQKAINQYHISQGRYVPGTGPSNTELAIREMYNNARALIMNGACFDHHINECYTTPEDQALHVIFIKMLGIAVNDERMLMLRAANAVALRMRSLSVFNIDDILNYLPLLRDKDYELYRFLLNKFNQRRHKLSNGGKHYSGGLLGLKVTDCSTPECVDRFLVPEEGWDLPFLIDLYYCDFWRNRNKRENHDYICQRIYSVLPPDWQRWFDLEFARRSKIKNDIIQAISAGQYRQALAIITSAKELYPSLKELEKYFIKTTFSYKCKLSMDPQFRSIDKYGPDIIHDLLGSCPSAVSQIENL